MSSEHMYDGINLQTIITGNDKHLIIILILILPQM